jgi:type I restriction enzyme S subunit
MSDDNELPEGWAKTRVDAIVQLVNGFAFKPTQWKSEGLPIIRIQNLNNPDASFNYCPENLPDKVRVRNGDLLFAWSGTPGTSFGAHIWRGDDAWLNQHIFKVLFHREHLDVRFLRLAINQNLDSYIRQAHGGAGLAHITKGRFEESELYIAPLNEQSRIVAKIEELFSDLDAGVAALKRAKANLKRYRASVLKSAVEGKLTEQWRAKHPAKEPASALLARILLERRQKWEADQLAKFAAAKKEPPKNWRDKYVEPTPPDTTGLPELPVGWCWASVEQLLVNSPQNGAYFPKSLYGSGIPIIRIDDYQQFWSRSANEVQRVQVPPRDIELYGLSEGDILVNRVNSMTHLGKVLLIEARHLQSIFESNMMRLRCVEKQVVTYVRDYLTSHSGIVRLRADAKWAVNQASINQQDVQRTPVPFPPLAEQQRIVSVVDETLSQIDAAEVQIEHGLLRAARLRQSILKRAFEGKLVPQDPKDEPASALLERLRTSRTHDEANGTAATSKQTRAKIKESSGEPRTRIRRRASTRNQQEE